MKLRTVRKKPIKVQAFCLHEDIENSGNELYNMLKEQGLIKQVKEEDGPIHWLLFSQESQNGEVAKCGDYVKQDPFLGKPYPNNPQYFAKNHRQIGDNLYEETSQTYYAWRLEDGMCREIQFLIDHKGLVMNEKEEEKYFNAPLWGDMLTASKDDVILFYQIDYDENHQVTDASFNFVNTEVYKEKYEEV